MLRLESPNLLPAAGVCRNQKTPNFLKKPFLSQIGVTLDFSLTHRTKTTINKSNATSFLFQNSREFMEKGSYPLLITSLGKCISYNRSVNKGVFANARWSKCYLNCPSCGLSTWLTSFFFKSK